MKKGVLIIFLLEFQRDAKTQKILTKINKLIKRDQAIIEQILEK